MNFHSINKLFTSYKAKIKIIENDILEKTKNIELIVSKSEFFTFRFRALFKQNTFLAIIALLFGMGLYLLPLLLRLSIINYYLKHPDKEIKGYDYFVNQLEKNKIDTKYKETEMKYTSIFTRLMHDGRIIRNLDAKGELIPIQLHTAYIDPPYNTKLKPNYPKATKLKNAFYTEIKK